VEGAEKELSTNRLELG